jgi:hypothetical protein
MMFLENNSMVVHHHHEDLKFCFRILKLKEKHTVRFNDVYMYTEKLMTLYS